MAFVINVHEPKGPRPVRSSRQQQSLLAHAREVHARLGLVAGALDVDDHTFAPLGVAHVVADS
jgi:hypothetical protein